MRYVSMRAATLAGMIAAVLVVATASWSQVPPAGSSPANAQAGGVPTLAPLVKKVMPSVVNIAIKGRVAQQQNPLLKDPFFRRFFNLPEIPAEREIRAAGSGVILDAREGIIVTNNHVVEHADEIAVTLADGRRFQAKRVGADPDTDIAVIKVPAQDLVAIPVGDSDELEVGDFVVAIGNPFGIGQTVTQGIISALRRTGLGIEGYEDFIQTDAPINPGNSGGALVSLRGELVGINTAIVGPRGGNVGIGFAIPINMVRDVAEQLVAQGEVRRGQLGIVIQDLTPDLIEAMGLPSHQSGAVIAKVEAGSAAESAGLKVGDVVTSIGNKAVRGAADLRNKVGLLRIGDAADLTVLRAGRSVTARAIVAAPVRKLIQGDRITSLLDGVVFGPAAASVPAKGVEIVTIREGSKAAGAGLRKGDIITALNQNAITGVEDFAARAAASPKRLLLSVVRDDSALMVVLQ